MSSNRVCRSEQKLGELGEFRNGANFSQEDYGTGYPIVNVKQLYRGRYASMDDLHELSASAVSKPESLFLRYGDILFARSSVKASGAGQVAMVGPCRRNAVFSGFIIRFRVKTADRVAPEYLNYLLRSPTYRELLTRIGTGTTITNLSQDTLAALPIPLPSLAEQKAIAAVLGALDDKIELNRRMNATLDGMARALFQSWFVDFDPVRAKLDDRKPALDHATAALFPERFEHEADSVVPTGWSRKRWGDIATLEYGKSLRDYRESGGKYRVFGTNGPIGFHNEALCNSAGLVIGRKGAYRGVHYSPDPFFAIDTAFYLKPKLSLDLKWAYYELLRFDINGMDSGSAIPSTSRDDFYGIPVIVPPPEIQDAFGAIVGEWFAKAFRNEHESRTLANLRDALLPKLLSGEITLKHAK